MELDIGIKLDLTRFLNHQPLLFMAKLAPEATIVPPSSEGGQQPARPASKHEQYLWKLDFRHNECPIRTKALWS